MSFEPSKKETLAQLSKAEQELCKAALEQRYHAYAPYSRFAVGAAIRSEKGDIFVGCNVENASFGLTVCAERHAVAAAVSAGQQKFAQLAIASDMQEPASPCGACRQVLNEFAPQLEILLVNTSGLVERNHLNQLLPRSFSGELLREESLARQTEKQAALDSDSDSVKDSDKQGDA